MRRPGSLWTRAAPGSTIGFIERQWSEEVGGATYGLTSRYSFEITDRRVLITVKVNFTGLTPPAAWFGHVPAVWNKYQAVRDAPTRKVLPIDFEMVRGTGPEAMTVAVAPGTGRANAGRWFAGRPDAGRRSPTSTATSSDCRTSTSCIRVTSCGRPAASRRRADRRAAGWRDACLGGDRPADRARRPQRRQRARGGGRPDRGCVGATRRGGVRHAADAGGGGGAGARRAARAPGTCRRSRRPATWCATWRRHSGTRPTSTRPSRC